MATRTQTTLVAVFRNTAEAEAAVTELQAVGVHRDHILVTSTNTANTYQTSTNAGTAYEEGGIKGWWHSMFGNDNEDAYDRDRYENAIGQGNVLLSVDTTDQNENTIADIINRHSPINVHEESPKSASTRVSRTEPTTPEAATARSTAKTNPQFGITTPNTGAVGGSETIPVVQEELKIGKRSVLRGGVRVYSRVVEQPVEESIGLREEHVRVDRQRVDRPATGADLRPGQEQVIEVKEFTEEPIVSKQTRVVEEVRVNKEATQRTETVRDTVRRTEVDVEPLQGDQTMGRTGTQAAPAFDADTDAAFRRDYETNYGSSGQPYDYYSGAYGYGYTMAKDPKYRNRRFEDVEDDLRADYGRRYPNSTWDRIKNSVRYGWNRLTNRT